MTNLMVRTSVSDGDNIIISDLCNIHIYILAQHKYFWRDIYLQTLCLSYRLRREGKDGKFILRNLLPNTLKVYQVYFSYLLHSTFNSTVSFVPSAFSTPNNALRYTDLQFKTSVTPQPLQCILVTQNSLLHSHEIELFFIQIISRHLNITAKICVIWSLNIVFA